MIYILDACTVIGYFRQEPGWETIAALLADEKNSFFIHAVNLCEVYYNMLKGFDETYADEILKDLHSLGVVVRQDLDEPFWRVVGQNKADKTKLKTISLADCFAISLALRLQGMILTSDRKEFEPVAQHGICPVSFFR